MRAAVCAGGKAEFNLAGVATFHCRSRCVEHKYPFIKGIVHRKIMDIKGIAWRENPAYILMKLIPMGTVRKWGETTGDCGEGTCED